MPLRSISKKDNMSFDNICYFITQAYDSDDIGNQIVTSTEKLCYCAELPITSNEYSVNFVNGIKPELCLTVDYECYDEQKQVKYNDIIYDVYRKYPRDDGIVELYLSNRMISNVKH